METTAQVMTADDFVAACGSGGVKLRLMEGWKQRGRGVLSEWGPMRGVVISASGASGVRESVARAMHPSGGLGAQAVVDDEGTAWVCGWGRAQSVGQGSFDVLSALTDGRRAPLPVLNSADGNRYLYSIQAAHSDNALTPWSEEQVDGLVAVCASLAFWHRWPGVPVLGRWEWARGGRGPAGLDMVMVRQKVQRRVSALMMARRTIMAQRAARDEAKAARA